MNFFNGKILNIVLSKTVRFIKNSPIPQTSLEYMSRNKNVIEALKSTSARQGVPQVCVLLTIVREDEGKAAAVVWGNLRWGVWGRSSAELPPGPDTSVAASRADERGARPANREKSDFLTGSDEGVAATLKPTPRRVPWENGRQCNLRRSRSWTKPARQAVQEPGQRRHGGRAPAGELLRHPGAVDERQQTGAQPADWRPGPRPLLELTGQTLSHMTVYDRDLHKAVIGDRRLSYHRVSDGQ